MICRECGATHDPGTLRCTNCGADMRAQSRGLTQQDVFWAVLKAGLALFGLQILVGIAIGLVVWV